MDISRNIAERITLDPAKFEVRTFTFQPPSGQKHYVYIEIGGRKVEIGSAVLSLGDGAGVHIDAQKYTSLVHRDLDEDIDYLHGDHLYELIKKHIDALLAQDDQIEALVISTAGTIKDGNLVSSHNLKKFIAINFTQRLHDEYGQRLRIQVYNDAEALIWGSLYFSQDAPPQHLIDVIVGAGFNLLYSKIQGNTIEVYKTFVDDITFDDGILLEDIIAGKFIDKNRHKYFPEFLHYVSAGNVKAACDALARVLGLPVDATTIVFQGGIIENVPIYAEKFGATYPHAVNAKDLSGGQNINAYGAIYHDLFTFEGQRTGV